MNKTEKEIVAWLRQRHDEHMNNAGWFKSANGAWFRAQCFDGQSHNEWVAKANEAYAIRSYIERGEHRKREKE